ncbi:MAG TPA: beta-phosphoglucomutase family hydrolase [Solirubrobacteraceae bacterium]|nr:beta-phosphoglucomutase family hydrolase [Solirubrobacteraceae bacterium]
MPPLLPEGIRACLFDLDGVLTDTSRLHAAAWKAAFDPFLAARGARPFDRVDEYERHVDGRRRADGVRSFLAARGIDAPPHLVDELAARKNEVFLRLLDEHGVEPFPGSLRFVDAVRAAGLAAAVVSSSANAAEVLEAAGLARRFAVVVDGRRIERERLAGKPAPDSFLAGAHALGLEPAAAAVLEDAPAGVRAGRAGGFGWVVGVDRNGGAAALRKSGADVVVGDLSELVA